jgi:hypothetical protein
VTMEEINHNAPATVHSLSSHEAIHLKLLMNGKFNDNICNHLSIGEFVRCSGMPIWTPTSCASLRAVGISYESKSSFSQVILYAST